jgi:large subunit ribosomal protein L17
LAKAKELRKYVEPIISKSKEDNTHSRRTVFSYLKSKEVVKELFGPVAQKVGDRPGGYTRILKLVNRKGDNAEMSIIELVDFNEAMLAEKGAKAAAKKSTRRGRKPASKPAAESNDAPATEEN